MLTARKNRLVQAAIYRALIAPALWQTFHRVWLRDERGPLGRGLPTIIYSNHVSWWDGYVAMLLERAWHGEFYLMMEEAQLRRYRFFQWCGCFSVDRQHARAALKSVQYAASLLRDQPQRTLFIFPQGTITPNDRRPLVTYPGAAYVAKYTGPVRGVPMALRLEFRGEQRPEIFVRLGPAHIITSSTTRATHAELEERLAQTVDALHADVNAATIERYTPLYKGRPSVNVVWDWVRGATKRK